jgi:hypothetical protein
VTAEQQLNEQGIEQRMAQARQRFRESALRLFRRCYGGEVDAGAEHEVAAGIEQLIAADSIETIETFSRFLSEVTSSLCQSPSATPSGSRPVPVSPDSARDPFLDWLQGFIEPFAD